jgi:hypothetical protein
MGRVRLHLVHLSVQQPVDELEMMVYHQHIQWFERTTAMEGIEVDQ